MNVKLILGNEEEILKCFEEAWTIEGSLVINSNPYNTNMMLLTKDDLNNNDLINMVCSNEDIIVIDTSVYKEVIDYIDILKSYLHQFYNISFNEDESNENRLDSIKFYARINRMLGGISWTKIK